MKNLFDREITFLSIIKFTIPTVIMMVFFSMYTIIDGVFISRFVGADALSSVSKYSLSCYKFINCNSSYVCNGGECYCS